MQLRSLSLLIFFVLVLCPAWHAQKKESRLLKKYAPELLKEDATVLRNVTLAMHPAIGIYRPREYYNRLFDEFTGSITDSLTEKQFRLKVKLLVDELHCGHTEVLYSKEFYREVNKQRWNYSPYIFIPVQNKVYMFVNLNKKQDTVIRRGVEITRINGIPVDSMLRYSKRFISSDGFIESARDHYIQLGFNSYYVGLFGRPDTFTVEYLDGKTPKTLRYPAIRPKSLPSLPLGPRDDSLFTRYKKAGMRFRYLDPEKKSFLLKIERFANGKDAKAYRKIFRRLRKNKSENLVIDLRNNGGGSLANSYRLLSYLIDSAKTQTLRTSIRNYPYRKYTSGNVWFRFTRLAYRVIGKQKRVNDTDYFTYTIKPRKKNHFNGKVYVLINGGSFSASGLVAAYLKQGRRATFIGEETGGAMEGCNAGITPYYRLPNTHIRVRMPAFRIVHDVCPAITGQGVLPDHRTEYTIRDILAKRDLELLKVKELIGIK